MKRLLTLLLAAAMLFSCALAETSSLGLNAEVKNPIPTQLELAAEGFFGVRTPSRF